MQTVLLNTYLINLARAPERLAAMQGKLAAIDLDYERVEAVDGATLTFPNPNFSEKSYRFLHKRNRTPAEIGCYFSHIECVRRFLAGNASHALILEDDVSFEPGFKAVLSAALEDESWDILRLSTVNSGHKFVYRPLGPNHSLAISLTREKGAGAYVINRRAAKWLNEAMMPMRLAYDVAFDIEYLFDLRASFIVPLIAGQMSDAPSQIQSSIWQYRASHWFYLTVFPFRFYLEFWRVMLRGARLIRWKLKPSPRPFQQS
jgi:glycosyl transferase, family 25